MKRNGYTLEMLLADTFPEVVEEEERLQGGLYRKKHIPIDQIPAPAIDMESIIDASRKKAELIEPMETKENNGWKDYVPTPHDLLPFHTTMASFEDRDLLHPTSQSFAFFPERAHMKVTRYRGGKKVRMKKMPFDF